MTLYRRYMIVIGVVLATIGLVLAFPAPRSTVLVIADPHDPAPERPAKTAEPSGPSASPITATNAQIRRWIAQNRLPEAPAHGSVFLAMANNLWRDGPPDILLLGDSMTQQGIDPAELSKLVEATTGRKVRSFNAASSRARWGVNRLVVRYADKHHLLPKVAILSLSTRSAEDDAFYRNEVANRPFSSVAEGCDRDWSESEARRCQREIHDLRFRFRGHADMIEAAAAGHHQPTKVEVREGSWLRRDGYLRHPPMTVAEVEKDSERRLDHNPGLPHVTDEGKAYFRDTVQLLRSRGVTVIACSLPYTPVHQANLEAKYPGYDQRRQQAAAELAASADVPFFQVTCFGSWWGDNDSRDAIHLTEQGARKFTGQLWEIPGLADAVLEGLGQDAAATARTAPRTRTEPAAR